MPTTTTLSALQTLILTTAATREDESVFPFSNAAEAKRQTRSLRGLLSRELIEQIPITAEEQTWKSEGGKPIGLVLTRVGREAVDSVAIDVEPTETLQEQGSPDGGRCPSDVAAVARLATRPGTKQALVLEMLGRDEGATLDQLVTATGWLPHTTRAALTSLRKKGYAVESAKEGDVRIHRVAGAVS